MKTIVIFALLFPFFPSIESDFSTDSHKKCIPITIPMCQGIGYNRTFALNQYGQDTKADAGLEVHQFWPLVEVNCYSHLRFFLCSMYAPICQENYDGRVPPCREVCQKAQAGCQPLMGRYGFKWPDNLNCSRLPLLRRAKSTGKICAAPPEIRSARPTKMNNEHSNGKVLTGKQSPCTVNCRCKHPFVASVNGIVGNVSHCSYPCHSPHFRKNVGLDHRKFLRSWLLLWSSACFICSLFTVLTFVSDVDRFRYPERPIFILAFCQLLYSCGYILRLGYGHEFIACTGVRVNGRMDGSLLCTLVFLLIYFFGMAVSVWWIILTLTWLLAAGFKWSSEAIVDYANWFHLFAWSLPAIQTVLVVTVKGVDGDPMSGLCYVGSTDVTALRMFVLGPLIAYLALGSLFLIAGFLNLWRIRSVVQKQQGASRTDKLTRLMSKIGVFSVLYTIPALAVIVANIYESRHRSVWETNILCTFCTDTTEFSNEDTFYLCALIKHAASLVVGVTAGVWILSGKTAVTWKRVLGALCRCRLPEPSTSVVHRYQLPSDFVYVKSSHTNVSSQIYGSTVFVHGRGYNSILSAENI